MVARFSATDLRERYGFGRDVRNDPRDAGATVGFSSVSRGETSKGKAIRLPAGRRQHFGTGRFFHCGMQNYHCHKGCFRAAYIKNSFVLIANAVWRRASLERLAGVRAKAHLIGRWMIACVWYKA